MRKGRFKGNEICLTFDDDLKCQYDIALPVLREYGLTAFWFVYTSPLCGELQRLEVYRHFRCTHFEIVEQFYQAFLEKVRSTRYRDAVERALSSFDPSAYAKEYAFYTEADKIFRFVRDDVLGQEAYYELMDEMLDEAGYDRASLLDRLWMNANDLRDLHEAGHIIGLHSQTHPTTMGRLAAEAQAKEYQENHRILSEIIGRAPVTMAHPANSYNGDTLHVLLTLGIELGFRANMADVANRSRYEQPREDHANIVKRMRQ